MQAPKYTVNLDEPASKRWIPIVKKYKQEIKTVVDKVCSQFPLIISPFVDMAIRGLIGTGTFMYEDEILSIAKTLGITPSLAILLQLIYEATACCTTIVHIVPSGVQSQLLQLIRTMDWPLLELKAITIEVTFIKDSLPLFKSTTWAGYVGVLTGMGSKYAISVNFRRSSGNLIHNVRRAISGNWPIGYLVRDILESDCSYKRAVKQLRNTELVAPTYFTICGMSHAKIIARDPLSVVYEQEIESGLPEVPPSGPLEGSVNAPFGAKGGGTLIQTNMDAGTGSESSQNILYSKERLRLAKRGVGECTDKKTLFKLMNMHPITNESTIYCTYMCSATNSIETLVL